MIRSTFRRAREGVAERMLRIGVLRRWYVRRILKFIDKSKKKHRPLPDHLEKLDTLLQRQRVPQHLRAKALEEMMLAPRPKGEAMGREFRRAASRQDRGSGRGGARKRPGLPPQQVMRRQQVRQVKGR